MIEEECLPGGATGAIRRGEEVVRPTGAWSTSVHALMKHVRGAGVHQVPEVSKIDKETGLEHLRWIAGEMVTAAEADAVRLVRVGHLVRAVHDALEDFRPPGNAVWRLRERGDTFVHGDISPWNVVWHGDDVVGVLDWDESGPGRDLEDLAYAAWVWVPLADPRRPADHWMAGHYSLAEQARRLHILVDAYGASVHDREVLLEDVAVVQASTIARIACGAVSGEAGFKRLWRGGRRIADLGQSMVWSMRPGTRWQSSQTRVRERADPHRVVSDKQSVGFKRLELR